MEEFISVGLAVSIAIELQREQQGATKFMKMFQNITFLQSVVLFPGHNFRSYETSFHKLLARKVSALNFVVNCVNVLVP